MIASGRGIEAIDWPKVQVCQMLLLEIVQSPGFGCVRAKLSAASEDRPLAQGASGWTGPSKQT